MNIDELTIGDAKKLSALFGKCAAEPAKHDSIPVVVCTDKRGVVFGQTDNADARPIILTEARMCLYWSADVGGVFGLAENGPTKDCKISATVTRVTLEGVTAVFGADPKAATAWIAAPVQGR